MGNNKKQIKEVLEIKLLELISLRIGQTNDCLYCIQMHHQELKELGESELRLTLLNVWEKVPHFSKKERTVLGLVEELCDQNCIAPSKETLKTLLVYFSEYQVDKLVVSIKTINQWSWLMKTFGYDDERF